MLMRALRQLSPFVWIMGVSGLLLCGASLALATRQLLLFTHSFPGIPADTFRMAALSVGLSELGMACALPTSLYAMRVRRAAAAAGPLPPGAPRPPDSWKLKLVSVLIPATPPLCVIMLALVIPSTSRLFGLTFAAEFAGALVLIGCGIWVIVRSREEMSDPRLRQWRQYRVP